MAKLTWNAFVTKHKAGYGLGTGTNNFPKLTPYAPNGKKWPSPAAALAAAIKPKMKGDWAVTTRSGTIKKQRIVSIHFVFKEKDDLIFLARMFGSDLSTPTANNKLPFGTFDSVVLLDPEFYGKLAKHLGYVK